MLHLEILDSTTINTEVRLLVRALNAPVKNKQYIIIKQLPSIPDKLPEVLHAEYSRFREAYMICDGGFQGCLLTYEA